MSRLGALGFIGGAAGQALKALESRQDEEREIRKAKMLEQLRRDTTIYLADYQEKLESKKVDDKQSMFDPSTGEYVMRNSKGEEIGRRADKAMAEEYEFGKKKNQMALDVSAANIRQSDAAATASRASATYSAGRLSLDKKLADAQLGEGNGKMTEVEAAQELVFKAKDLTAQARALGINQAKIEELAQLAVNNANSPDQATLMFRDAIGALISPRLQKKASPF